MDVEQITTQDTSDWELVRRLLPGGWREKARELGAMRRAKRFADGEALLRTLLIHLTEGCSLKETAVRARYAGLASVSSVAIWKRLRRSGEWLRWMAEGVMQRWIERLAGETLPGPYRLRLVDASVVSEPGSTGSDWRIHYAVELGSLRCDSLKVTDPGQGETFKQFAVRSGDLLIGDRVYANRPGVAHVVRHGGDVLVRLTVSNLALQTESGKPFPLLGRLRTLKIGKIGEWPCWIPPEEVGEERIAARVCAVKKSRTASEEARRKLRREASRDGRTLQPDTIEAAGYIFLLSTVPARALQAAQLLEVYRGRWQIELAFKRLKSIIQLSHLPKQDDDGARAWLHGKLLVAFLVEALIHLGESFFPWGYPLDGELTQAR